VSRRWQLLASIANAYGMEMAEFAGTKHAENTGLRGRNTQEWRLANERVNQLRQMWIGGAENTEGLPENARHEVAGHEKV